MIPKKRNDVDNFHSNLRFFMCLCLAGLLQAAPLQFKYPLFQHEAGVSLVLDPYRSFTNAYLGLKRDTDFLIYDENELALYSNLVANSARISHLLIEGTVYPIAWTTAYLHDKRSDIYRRFTIFNDINILSSLAGGMREPWSGSLFLGQIASFWHMDEKEEVSVTAHGINGVVLTAGAVQIFDDYLVPSRWWRLEYKVKGNASLDQSHHNWEIKFGYRWYGLNPIDNTFLLVLNCEKYTPKVLSWELSKNSRTEFELQVPPRAIKQGVILFKVTYGKVLPYKKYLIGGLLGINYEHRRLYDGKHFSSQPVSIWSLVFQPLLVW